MDIRESFTYSFLIHFFLIIILATGLRSSMSVKDWTVSLVSDNATTMTVDKEAADNSAAQVIDNEMPEPDDTIAKLPEETPIETAEKQPEPLISKIEEEPNQTNIPIDNRRARIQRMLIYHLSAFLQHSANMIDVFISDALSKTDLEPMNGQSARVFLYYDNTNKGILSGVDIVSESQELKAALEEIRWGAVILPSAYLLNLKGLDIKVTIAKNTPYVSIIFL